MLIGGEPEDVDVGEEAMVYIAGEYDCAFWRGRREG